MMQTNVMLQPHNGVWTHLTLAIIRRYETEKKHGAGRGNWGTEEEDVKE